MVISVPARSMLGCSDRVRSARGCDVKLILALSAMVRILVLCLFAGFVVGCGCALAMTK